VGTRSPQLAWLLWLRPPISRWVFGQQVPEVTAPTRKLRRPHLTRHRSAYV
jgi:hypothetical protein